MASLSARVCSLLRSTPAAEALAAGSTPASQASAPLALPLASAAVRRIPAIRADTGNMDQSLNACVARGICDRLGAADMYRLVTLAAALERNPGGVDDGLAAGDGRRDRIRHPEIGAHDRNLADIARSLDGLGEFDASHGDPDLQAFLRQRPHNGPAEEAAAAENRDLSDAHGMLPTTHRGRRARALRLTSARPRPNSRPH